MQIDPNETLNFRKVYEKELQPKILERLEQKRF